MALKNTILMKGQDPIAQLYMVIIIYLEIINVSSLLDYEIGITVHPL